MEPTFYPPIRKLVNIGNHQLQIHITGEGSPSVVLEEARVTLPM